MSLLESDVVGAALFELAKAVAMHAAETVRNRVKTMHETLTTRLQCKYRAAVLSVSFSPFRGFGKQLAD